MNNIALALVLVLFGNVTLFSAEPTQHWETVKCELLTTTLKESGLDGMLKAIKENRWKAPVMLSNYRLRIMEKKDPEQAKVEKAKRDFGKALCLALDDEAKRLQKPASSDEWARSATQLLDLADWIKMPGYGNALIFYRCTDLSTVPMVYLITDLEYSINTIEMLLSRIITIEDVTDYNAEVLNNEALTPFIKKLSGTKSERFNQLSRSWYIQYKESIKWFETKGLSPFPVTKEKCNILPDEHVLFYEESDRSIYKKASLSWDINAHYRLLSSVCLGSYYQRIKKYYIFRKNVGHFPEKPIFTEKQLKNREQFIAEREKKGEKGFVKFEDMFNTLIHAGFSQAFQPYRDKYGPIAESAADVYIKAKAGQVYDTETQDEQLEAVHKAHINKQ